MGGGGLGDFVVAAGLDGVDEVGEEDGVLDEEDGDVVSDQVYTFRMLVFAWLGCRRGVDGDAPKLPSSV